MLSDLDVALEAARAGAEIVATAFGTGSTVSSFKTSSVDPVTETDKASERAIIDVIQARRPDDLVLAEESGGAAFDSGRVWIADPLDGTVNFVHGFPPVAVSVALWDNGVPRAGVVIDVTRGEEFSASSGAGAQLDGSDIRVSGQTDLGAGLVATGFPYDRRSNADRYGRVFTRGLVAGPRHPESGVGRARHVLRGCCPPRRILGVRARRVGRGRRTSHRVGGGGHMDFVRWR